VALGAAAPADCPRRPGAWRPSRGDADWIRQDEADRGERADRPTTAEQEELRRLRKENLELRRANEILRAASAYFAAELCAARRRCAVMRWEPKEVQDSSPGCRSSPVEAERSPVRETPDGWEQR
jgi:hypothetical protein